VVVAGGTGSRFGGQKQFELLEGRPVVAWSVAAARAASDGIVVVVPKALAEPPADKQLAEELGADLVVAGGVTRSRSVRAGLAAVPAEASVIIVHDAARPLASASLFASVVEALIEDGLRGAIPVLPVTDTLKYANDDRVFGEVVRELMVSVQTPQAFPAAILRAAHSEGGEATDDSSLLLAMGAGVDTVPGEPRNLKLTRPEDLALIRALLQIEREGQ
jgi:2-C-methyl-D-erythritol 4-phosphate cytidylyltransferase